jgi:hypothetical protein
MADLCRAADSERALAHAHAVEPGASDVCDARVGVHHEPVTAVACHAGLSAFDKRGIRRATTMQKTRFSLRGSKVSADMMQ